MRNLGWKYWAVEVFMVALAGYNFWLAALRWGFQDTDVTVAVGAVILAAATEIGLVVFLHLQRSAVYAEQRNGWQVLVWVLLSGGCIAVSLYVNQLYFKAHWHDVDGNLLIDQWIRSAWPMVLLVGAALVPPKALRSVTEIAREYDVRVYEAQRKQELAQVQEQPKESRRDRAAKQQAKQAQLRRIAGDLMHAYQTTDEDGDTITDWVGLQADLEARGLYPEQYGLASLPPNETLIHAAKTAERAAEEAQDEDDERSNSGNHRAFISAREIASVLDVSLDVAKDMIAPFSKHKFAIKGAKNIRLRKPVRGRDTERRAPYATVLEVKAKLDADRAQKLRPFPPAQDEQVRA
jgi:hypothetical protein